MGLIEVPAVSLTESEAELRTLRLALNRITDDSVWESEELALEFSEILELAPQIDLEVIGFEMGEIDFFWTVAASLRKTSCRRLTLRLHR